MKLTFDYSLFGLEPRDLKVYEAMLANPEASSIRTIAGQVGMNRGTTFEIIKKLVIAGLVAGDYKNSRKYYRALEPESLAKMAAQRQSAVANEIPKISQYVEQLENIQPEPGMSPFSKHFDGQDEIAVLLQDVLSTVALSDSKSYRVVSSAEVSNQLYSKFRNFTRQRIKQGLFVKVIGVGGQGSIDSLAERKALSSAAVPASYIIIYGDKVALITLTSLGGIQGSVIQDDGIAKLQQILFDTLWEKL